MSTSKKTVEFLLDENVDVRLQDTLTKFGCKSSFVKKGAVDKQIFEMVKSEGLILLTNDKDFASDVYTVNNSCGIIVFMIHPTRLLNLERGLDELFKKMKPKDLYGKTVILFENSAEVYTPFN